MNIEDLRDYCMSKKGTTEEFPFDETTLVFKVMGRMYVLTDLESEFAINLKCDPDKAVELREQYASITPAFHMNKTHWATIRINGTLSDAQLQKWIDESYQLVAAKLTRKQKEELNNL
ncbi:MmcQ/YjbR family DNA-binding protein [Mangrovibacterium marinum]|uniref:Putative DNA-binding protein (MmcQ/YjbR family) n=1 Tax=Mangrovibacterium marinum TaxID=1639118 RepID=A0A2T5C706_9BACT|nr:MmcQ/YjbR family DNA-binding protein [Mangrovibacterium marinum]PTN10702.1 putative DNA-binding protein (MmcQ/YjbR family) [Mangrovibacterium marinum]